MASITYTAVDRGYLVSSHVAGTDYDIDFEVSRRNQSFKTMNTLSRSYSGAAEVLYNRIDEFYDITATFLDVATHDKFVELFSSAAAGESFSYDLTGTAASPGSTIVTCTLENYSLGAERIGVTDVFNISMKLRIG